ncbi:DUF3429 domain-containing protein [Pseudidiomarina taiwanensis]|uniref:DUF3429 domain-containing protein n=1 Tax=Pseudidiomarina taiwanensis TaxID=337250 RepID=A0A432ZK19_9GAMM|nr:DUF3429 domain-containing protein [Pseudidiomarina taiwanensis]RUO78316.1 hypothetical protein CWI83_04590 [Pseudidiomarina taiwanensis]
MMTTAQQSFATRLGFAGLLPFLLLACAALLDIYGRIAVTWFIYYSAIIISFIAGIQWGLVMQSDAADNNRRLGWCMVPPVIAWALVAAGEWWSYVAVTAGLALLHLFWLNYERRHYQAHPWYLELRSKLTFTVVALHVIIAVTKI